MNERISLLHIFVFMVFWYRAPKVLPQREKEREKNEKKQQSSVHVKREGGKKKKKEVNDNGA